MSEKSDDKAIERIGHTGSVRIREDVDPAQMMREVAETYAVFISLFPSIEEKVANSVFNVAASFVEAKYNLRGLIL